MVDIFPRNGWTSSSGTADTFPGTVDTIAESESKRRWIIAGKVDLLEKGGADAGPEVIHATNP
jgi:hypothetical protein